MNIEQYHWANRPHFINRTKEVQAINNWFQSSSSLGILALYGRRRVGKSWLFRAAAHGKPAVILVANETAPKEQLHRFAEQLEPIVGVKPTIDSLPDLWRLLYKIGATQKVLIVIDEFTYLLAGGAAKQRKMLTTLQAITEEEQELQSQSKILLCSSYISQMETLTAVKSPMHGRIQSLEIHPLQFSETAGFYTNENTETKLMQYAVAGGMSLYLRFLAEHTTIKDAIIQNILEPYSPLFSEARKLLEQELEKPQLYFSILQALATGAKPINEISQEIETSTSTAAKYILQLEKFKLIERKIPVTEPVQSRKGQFVLKDNFFRFWFRFVFPYENSLLNEGLSAENLYTSVTEQNDQIQQHISIVFEEICRQWVLQQHATKAQKVGGWWGPALPKYRLSEGRQSEEVDIVGMNQNKITVVGECKWTNAPMGLKVLADLEEYKIPAMIKSAKASVAKPDIFLFSRSGFGSQLEKVAQERADIQLINADAVINDLLDT